MFHRRLYRPLGTRIGDPIGCRWLRPSAAGRCGRTRRLRRFSTVAYDVELAERIRELLAGEPVTEKKMFGGLAFLLNGNMSVAASGQGGLMVRVDPDETADLLGEPGAAEFDMGGRGPMKGWLRVGPEVLDDDETLGAWVSRGVSYARSLPPK
jgi:TfoX/Sxy family transcriptional regulator of competence genes